MVNIFDYAPLALNIYSFYFIPGLTPGAVDYRTFGA